jgi:hypothetical protein
MLQIIVEMRGTNGRGLRRAAERNCLLGARRVVSWRLPNGDMGITETNALMTEAARDEFLSGRITIKYQDEGEKP